jgi:hypothetical protein
MGRYRISEQTVERLRSFLEKKHAKEGNLDQFDWLGGDTSPGYTVDDAVDELLSEAGV